MYKKRTLPKRIIISKTKEEWASINQRLADMGRSDFNSFLRGEISKLVTQNKGIEEPSPEYRKEDKIDKYLCLTDHYHTVLYRLSLKMKMPVSTMINQIIISPLLRN